MNLSKHLTHPIFSTIAEIADDSRTDTYIIGGFVRDLILKRIKDKNDLDFVCIGSGIDFAKKVSKKLVNNTDIKYFRNFGTAMININDERY